MSSLLFDNLNVYSPFSFLPYALIKQNTKKKIIKKHTFIILFYNCFISDRFKVITGKRMFPIRDGCLHTSICGSSLLPICVQFCSVRWQIAVCLKFVIHFCTNRTSYYGFRVKKVCIIVCFSVCTGHHYYAGTTALWLPDKE